MSSESPVPVRRRLRKRVVIPLALVGLLGLFVLWAYVRGTWGDTETRDPQSSDEGVVVQLLRTPEGRMPVRCAAVVDQPIDKVWAAMTDYDHYGEIFPTLGSAPVTVTRGEGGAVKLRGVASSWLGDWPFDIGVHQWETNRMRVVWWHEKDSGEVLLNRGSFAARPLGEGKTLLLYSLEVELSGYPNFLVRNVLLSRQPGVLRALVERAKQ